MKAGSFSVAFDFSAFAFFAEISELVVVAKGAIEATNHALLVYLGRLNRSLRIYSIDNDMSVSEILPLSGRHFLP